MSRRTFEPVGTFCELHETVRVCPRARFKGVLLMEIEGWVVAVIHRKPRPHPLESVPFETRVPFGQLRGRYRGHEADSVSGSVHLYEVVQPYLSVVACHPVLQAVVGGGAIEHAVGAAGAHRFSMAERVRGPTTPKPDSGVPERMTPCADCHSCTDASVVGPKNPVGSP